MKRITVMMVGVIGMAGLVHADKIDIVVGVVSPGPARTANNVFPNAYDDNTGTFTYTTESGTTTSPQHTRLDFTGDGHDLGRIRINDVAGNDGNGAVTYTVRYTRDKNPILNARTYLDVSNLAVVADLPGDTMPNVSVTENTVQHLNTTHDGYYSVTFNAIPSATGFELEWSNTGFYKHWTVREIEGHDVPLVGGTVIYGK